MQVDTSTEEPSWINEFLPANVLYLVMGHPLVMGHFFNILKSMKIDHH